MAPRHITGSRPCQGSDDGYHRRSDGSERPAAAPADPRPGRQLLPRQCPGARLHAIWPGITRVDLGDVTDEPTWQPTTPSELRLREYLGTPGQVISRLAGHDVLVVQGAPVTDEVLDASPTLQLVCCARGGPVNVDVQAATERGIPVVTTPGKNAEAVADLTHGPA